MTERLDRMNRIYRMVKGGKAGTLTQRHRDTEKTQIDWPQRTQRNTENRGGMIRVIGRRTG